MRSIDTGATKASDHTAYLAEQCAALNERLSNRLVAALAFFAILSAAHARACGESTWHFVRQLAALCLLHALLLAFGAPLLEYDARAASYRHSAHPHSADVL
jgi:hypothetical protein